MESFYRKQRQQTRKNNIKKYISPNDTNKKNKLITYFIKIKTSNRITTNKQKPSPKSKIQKTSSVYDAWRILV